MSKIRTKDFRHIPVINKGKPVELDENGNPRFAMMYTEPEKTFHAPLFAHLAARIQNGKTRVEELPSALLEVEINDGKFR